MLCLTRNAGYSVSQPQTPSQLGFILTSLFLLTPYEVDCVASAKQIFSVFLFLVLYLLSYKIILPSALFCSSPSGDCLLHEVLNKGCLYDLNHLPLCCCFSVAKSGPTLGNPMNCSAPGFSDLYYLPEFTQAHVHWVSDAIQPSHPLSPLLLPPSIFPSIRVFSNESALRIRWPKYWSSSFSISPSNEHSGLISFRIDWLDLLAVQGTLKSLLQHHSLKASIIWHLAFFMVQFSHPYMTIGKTIALTIWTFVSEVMSLLFRSV